MSEKRSHSPRLSRPRCGRRREKTRTSGVFGESWLASRERHSKSTSRSHISGRSNVVLEVPFSTLKIRVTCLRRTGAYGIRECDADKRNAKKRITRARAREIWKRTKITNKRHGRCAAYVRTCHLQNENPASERTFFSFFFFSVCLPRQIRKCFGKFT